MFKSTFSLCSCLNSLEIQILNKPRPLWSDLRDNELKTIGLLYGKYDSYPPLLGYVNTAVTKQPKNGCSSFTRKLSARVQWTKSTIYRRESRGRSRPVAFTAQCWIAIIWLGYKYFYHKNNLSLSKIIIDMVPPSAPSTGELEHPDASSWGEKLTMDENIAIQCLENHIDKNCCWGKGPLKKMKIISVEPSTAYKVNW